MTDAPDNLVLEILRRMQADIAAMRQDLRDMKGDLISLRTIMAEFLKTDARRETDMLALQLDLERIKTRLDLTDA